MRVSFGRAVVLAAVLAVLAALGAGSASAQPASGNPPPPKGFEAASASFVSARTGFVLGTRRCSVLPCKARLRKTVNGGKTWTWVPAPAVSLVPPFTAPPLSNVSTVRFSSARDGWLWMREFLKLLDQVGAAEAGAGQPAAAAAAGARA